MKKLVSLALMASCLFISCGRSMVIDGVERKPVGLLSRIVPQNMVRTTYADRVQYDICWSNVIWGVVFCETVIAPIYFFGFSMFNPVGQLEVPEKI